MYEKCVFTNWGHLNQTGALEELVEDMGKDEASSGLHLACKWYVFYQQLTSLKVKTSHEMPLNGGMDKQTGSSSQWNITEQQAGTDTDPYSNMNASQMGYAKWKKPDWKVCFCLYGILEQAELLGQKTSW